MNNLYIFVMIGLLQATHCQEFVERSNFCPNVCKCRSTSVDCSSSSITTINWQFSQNTSNISLSQNSIHHLVAKPFANVHKSLKVLDLSYNNLTLLPQVIANFTKLQILNMSHNRIDIAYAPTLLAYNYSLNKCENLQILDLSHNRLGVIAKEFFNELKNLTHVYLGNNDFTWMSSVYFHMNSKLYTMSAPNGKIDNLYFSESVPFIGKDIDLSGNDFVFTKTTQNFLGGWSFKTFKIGHCQLRYFPKNFEGLLFLETLKLTQLCQEQLSSDIFKYLPNLRRFEVEDGEAKSISISNQNITDLRFSNLMNLSELVIVNTSLNAITLVNLSRLDYLTLRNCNVISFKKSFFSFVGSNSIKYLDLSKNPLEVVNEKNFQFFVKLEVLDLSYCKISEINHTFVQNLTNLVVLDLSGNFIKKIKSNFLVSPSIFFVNMSSNVVENVSSDSLKSLKGNLREFDLSYNRIKSIQLRNNNQALIYLQNNPLICDCSLVKTIYNNVVQYCQTTNPSLCYVCSNHSSNSLKPLASLKQECDEDLGKRQLLLIPGIVILVIITFIVIKTVRWKIKNEKGFQGEQKQTDKSQPTVELQSISKKVQFTEV